MGSEEPRQPHDGLGDARQREITLPAGGREGQTLEASLLLPPGPAGLVLVAHGSGSDRFSPRNRAVAARLQQGRLACLLPDLQTTAEMAQERAAGFPLLAIPLLADRLLAWIDWAERQPELSGLPLGLFGASTGAAAVLTAAALRPAAVSAVVCRGGRVDLAPAALPLVRCPVLLLVGERDREVLRLNRLAAGNLRCHHRLSLIPLAGHLFEEPGCLSAAAEQTAAWFAHHLQPREPAHPLHFHTPS